MFERYPISEGTRRVLNALLAESTSSPAPGDWTYRLLMCLYADGSRGAELLETHGVREETIREILKSTMESTGNAGSPSFEEWLSPVLGAAHRLAGREPGQTEIGTEHVLAALLSLVPEICTQLQLQIQSGDELLASTRTVSPEEESALQEAITLRSFHRPADEQADLFRTLDAAANRCREGLRVLEDYVRFQQNDRFLSGQLKQLRHDLQRLLTQLHEERWLPHRDSRGDVGPAVSRQLETPQFRGTIHDVIRANGKRVGEALRTLEEFGKLQDVLTAAGLEQIRYRFYTIEKALHSGLRNIERLANCRLYLLVTDRLCPQGLGPVVRESIQHGVDIVQLREKEMPDRRLIELARHVREWTAEAGVLFIVNDRPDIAVLSGADGVHLGQDDMTVVEARRIVGGQSLIGVSTHNLDQVRQAILDGADYLGVGPVFPSGTKNFDEFPGLQFVHEVSQETTLPWFPLGGITAENIRSVLDAGARRVAVSGAISRATSPGQAASELINLLTSPNP